MQPRTIIRALSLAAILAAAPLTIKSGQVVVTKACSQTEIETGTCCPERNSLCNLGDGDVINYYYKTSGRCKTLA